jgi:hypothetical protein
METVEIKRSNFPRLKKIPEKPDSPVSFQIEKSDIDEVSMVPEESLAEKWNSGEGARWDEML